MYAFGPQLPSIHLDAPEDPNPETEYEYQAVYNAPNLGHTWVEAGSDDSPEEALDRLRLILDRYNIVSLAAAVDVQDIHEVLEENQPDRFNEGDYVMQHDGNITQYEKVVYTVDPDDHLDGWRFIFDHCKQEGFWPNVWRLDDHGGLEIYTASEYPSKKEIGRAA